MTTVTAVTLTLYTEGGVEVSFTLGDYGTNPVAAVKAEANRLVKQGLLPRPPAALPKTFDVDGYVRTDRKNKQEGKRTETILLFAPYGDYHQVAVYVEDIPKLPFTPAGKVWEGGSIKRAEAVERNYYVKLQHKLRVRMAPVFTEDGVPVMNKTEQGVETGNQKSRFVEVVEWVGPEKAQKGQQAQQKPQQAPQARPAAQHRNQPAQAADKADTAGLLAQVWQMAPVVYGPGAWQGAVETIVNGVTLGDTKNPSLVGAEDLEKVISIIALDQAGTAKFGGQWREKLQQAVAGRGQESIYLLTKAVIDEMIAKLKT